MTSRPPTVVLASESPRRSDLLRRLLPDFVVRPSGAEAAGSYLLPERPFPAMRLPPGYAVPDEQNPMLWAWRKAMTVSDVAREYADTLIIGADTIVVLDGEVLGKPRDVAEARSMLGRLARRAHVVITGWVVLRAYRTRPGEGVGYQPDVFTGLVRCGYVPTVVQMADYSANVVDWYVSTREPMDKAGAYALQGQGAALVREVEGCTLNVIGLPLCQLRSILQAAGVPLLPAADWHAPCTGPYCTTAEG